MVKHKVTLDDLFEIQYDDGGDDSWFLVKAKPRFYYDTVRIDTDYARIDIMHPFKNEEWVWLKSGYTDKHDLSPINLIAYDKKPHGNGEATIIFNKGKKRKGEVD